MTAALVIATVVVVLGRRERSARTNAPQVDDVINQASLLAIAIGGGLNLFSAIAWSRPYLHPALAGAAAAVHKQSQLTGLASGLRTAEGAGAPLFQALARSVETGAAVGPTIDSFRARLEAEQLAAAERRAQRLPVKLLFPLALLMLPGLVLIIATPAVVDVLNRFD